MHQLHDYQKAAVHHTQQRIDAGYRRLYITLPTGTGKSVVLAKIADCRLEKGRVLVLIHRQDIAKQLVQTLRHAGLEVGLLMQGHHQLNQSIMVATVSSLTAETLHAFVDASEVPVATIFIDEAHHAVEGSVYERIVTTFENMYGEQQIVVVGFTATPYRSDTRSMLSLLPVCAFARDILEMVKAGWLASLTWIPVKIDIDLNTIPTMQSFDEFDYLDKDLTRSLLRSAITEEIVRQVVPKLERRPTLVFTMSVEHAEQFAEIFCKHGLHAVAISARTSQAQREHIFAKWRAGAIQVVCNCTLLTEGFDFPSIAALLIARPTLSPGLYVQMLGRGTRLAPGKKDCLVLDVMGNNPDMSKQVVLPQIIGVNQQEQKNVANSQKRPGASQSDPLLKAVLGADVETGLSLLDPIGQSPYRWTAYRRGYFTMVSDEIAAIVERDPSGSGLYRSRLYGREPIHQWIKQEYFPLRQQIAWVHEATDTLYQEVLGSKEAPWLDQPVSDKQLAALERSHRGLAHQARKNSWTKGTASEAITFCRLRETLEHPPVV